MAWIQNKKLTMLLTLAIILLLVGSFKMVQYHRLRERGLIHQLQKRREYLSEIWNQCFHTTFNHEESILENPQKGSELHGTIKETIKCKVGFVVRSGVCAPCPQGTFALEQWVVCIPLLLCAEMSNDVQIGNVLHTIGNWVFYVARWNNYNIIYTQLIKSDDSMPADFSTIQRLLPHDNLMYLIGECNREESTQLLFAGSINDILGCAARLDSVLVLRPVCDNEIVRYRVAMGYIQILAHLHSNMTRALVLCNSHSLPLLLSQFLIAEDLRLILGAYDNLPVLNVQDTESLEANSKVKCSRKELKGSFVAPEQKWPYQSSKVFNYAQQPGYTEKTDIWKIPDMTRALLNKKNDNYQNILDLLEAVHRKCKNLEPSSRPTAAEVLQEYQFVWKTLGFGKIMT